MTEIPVEQHFPEKLRHKYEFHQWKHACAILKSDFQSEWKDLVGMLEISGLKNHGLPKEAEIKRILHVDRRLSWKKGLD